MSIKKSFMLGIICLLLFMISGCATQKENNNKDASVGNSLENKRETENSQSIKEEKEQSGDNDTKVKKETQPKDDKELEKSLAAYRKKREKMTTEKNGIITAGAPDEEEYGIDTSAQPRFDTREERKAFEAASEYLTDKLGIEEEALNNCIDPRIFQIYKDKDKGVAKGYENDNIFVCEYCDNGTWQYMILVRDSKEDPWKVIHHGDSYKE
ncbi:hypothetical protein [Anaerosacchariphilus polymeriproducens]|uniref:Lipoprotein n=1 Tax=Anaerosacchariphilus polymeriproducens TaxID=1812858 RepID=A0A371AWK5_9FIRM|nr:hypothetical protein [Anaerosacchariphilus polymeriproducens]RDU23850.1 hypothetical protein DWV06_08305 [Anaerosacchariphilus polymeriproducens]